MDDADIAVEPEVKAKTASFKCCGGFRLDKNKARFAPDVRSIALCKPWAPHGSWVICAKLLFHAHFGDLFHSRSSVT